MRLSEYELDTIRHRLYAVDPHGGIDLFGSRILDSGSGGDVDIYKENLDRIEPDPVLKPCLPRDNRARK